jgi:hypothetical protein
MGKKAVLLSLLLILSCLVVSAASAGPALVVLVGDGTPGNENGNERTTPHRLIIVAECS